tara:strand:+ start:103 stop:651 length:549 start_codon:yes stop_codon:yes gene_type:complete
MKKKSSSLLEQNIRDFLSETGKILSEEEVLREADPYGDPPRPGEQGSADEDPELDQPRSTSVPEYDMDAQLQDVMDDEELEAYGAGYDVDGNPLSSEPRNDLSSDLKNSIYPAVEAGMSIKSLVDVFAESLMTGFGFEEDVILDAFSSFIRATEEGSRRTMSERRLFEASKGRWQKLSGLKG